MSDTFDETERMADMLGFATVADLGRALQYAQKIADDDKPSDEEE